MKITLQRFPFFLSLLATQICFGQGIKVLTNHIGYEWNAPKGAVILGHANDEVTGFKVIDSTGKEALSGQTVKVGLVDHWKDWYFWSADFSALTNKGTYLIECSTSEGSARSFPFQVEDNLLERNTLSSVIYYFKEERCSGLLDKADRNLKFEGLTNTADVHGGWYDATGDYGKHLGGLGFSMYYNMQPLPVAAWR